MVNIVFAIIFVIYCILASIAYLPSVKNSSYYYWIGLGFALITNSLWLYLSKHTADPKMINKYSYIWDGIILLTASIIPILFFNVIPRGIHLVGIVFVIVGIILLKL